MDEKLFTKSELNKFDGEQSSRMYIAFRGVVYDVTNCPKWKAGLHERTHFPGQDLTHELEINAPHKEEVFKHHCVKKVGVLLEQEE